MTPVTENMAYEGSTGLYWILNVEGNIVKAHYILILLYKNRDEIR